MRYWGELLVRHGILSNDSPGWRLCASKGIAESLEFVYLPSRCFAVSFPYPTPVAWLLCTLDHVLLVPSLFQME